MFDRFFPKEDATKNRRSFQSFGIPRKAGFSIPVLVPLYQVRGCHFVSFQFPRFEFGNTLRIGPHAAPLGAFVAIQFHPKIHSPYLRLEKNTHPDISYMNGYDIVVSLL